LAEEVDADDNILPDVVEMISETEVAGKKNHFTCPALGQKIISRDQMDFS